MFFGIAAILLFMLRLALVRFLPWRIFSVSTVNLAGVLLYIALGLELRSLTEHLYGLLITIIFYLFLLLGEYLGQKFPLYENIFARLADWFRCDFKFFFLAVFLIYSSLPLIQALYTSQPINEMIVNTWATYGIQERSARLVEWLYGQQSISGARAVLLALLRQSYGLWLLSIGIVWFYWRRTALLGLFLHLFGVFVTSGGARSPIFLDFGIIVILVFLSMTKGKTRFRHILIILFLFFAALLLNDALLLGRSGLFPSGTVLERIRRALYTDFAYGGLGIYFATSSRHASFETGLEYFLRLALLPIPRVMWPRKPILDPNWEMTEYFWGTSISEIGSITLFTPVAEALFYFGYVGLIIIPVLYGFTTTYLERIYSSSAVYFGLLAQVYLWTFLGMRHTFWNLYSALVVGNLFVLVVLFSFKNLKYSSVARKICGRKS